MYERIYSRHIFYLYFNSLYLKLLVSPSNLSEIRKDILKYKLSEMNFDFEISRVDFVSKENHFSPFNIKIHISHLNHPLPRLPHFFRKINFLSTRSTPMHLVYVSKNFFSSLLSGLSTLESTSIILPNRRIMRLALNS